MTIVVDTGLLIDHLRGRGGAIRALERARSDERRVAGSTLTKTEVLAGMRPDEEIGTRRLLDGLEWIDVDEDVAERAGDLARHFTRTHPSIEIVDYIIAATTEFLGATLWTTNPRHFPMFPDLPDPYGDS